MSVPPTRFVAVVLLVAVSWSGTVHAEGWHWKRGRLQERIDKARGGFAGEVALFGGELDAPETLLVSPLFGGWYPVGEHFELALDWGLVYHRERGGDTSREFRVGNPQLAGYYTTRTSRVTVHAGAGFTVPAATLPGGADRDHAVRAYDGASAARGAWSFWLWLPEAATIFVPVRIETATHRGLLLAGEAGFAVPIRLHGGGAEFATQTAGEVGYRGEHGGVGVRLQAVWLATGDGDFFQASVEPFFRIDFDEPFIMGRLTMNLDDPYGFAFDDGGVWAVHVGGGVDFR